MPERNARCPRDCQTEPSRFFAPALLRRATGWLLALGLLLGSGPALAHEARPILWFDQGHGQVFHIDRQGALDLSRLATQLSGLGWQVETGGRALTGKLLEQVDGLVLSGAFRAYRAEEVEAILRFMQGGKRVAIMLHIAPPYADLLARLGVVFSNGVVREAADRAIDGEPLNFTVTRLAEHPLTEGVESVSLFGSWALLNDDPRVEVLAKTSPQSWVDLNNNQRLDAGDARQSFAVVLTGEIGTGGFVVFADDALFQNQFFPLNQRLADNLGRWLGRFPVGVLALKD